MRIKIMTTCTDQLTLLHLLQERIIVSTQNRSNIISMRTKNYNKFETSQENPTRYFPNNMYPYRNIQRDQLDRCNALRHQRESDHQNQRVSSFRKPQHDGPYVNCVS